MQQESVIRFPSKKSPSIAAVIWGTVILMLFSVYLPYQDQGVIIIPLVVIAALVIVFLVWLWFDTSYKLTPTHLYYCSGPFRGKILLHDIQDIRKAKKMAAGYRPALGFDGLIIKYSKYDELYISPKNRDQFLQYVQKHISQQVS